MNKYQVIKILERHNLRPLKSKGQNFLIDEDITMQIVNLLSDKQTRLIEVGPGLGALTRILVNKPYALTVVEVDKGYAKYLTETYPELDVQHADFLKYKISELTTSFISNIPYNLTTKIIEKIIIETKNLNEFVFMVQKDVEERFFAKVGSKEYGPLTVLLDLIGVLEFKFDVGADKFYPEPHVKSAVFKFTKTNHELPLKAFYSFLKTLFRQRRKTLTNNIPKNTDENSIFAFFDSENLPHNIRAEALTPRQLWDLFKKLDKAG